MPRLSLWLSVVAGLLVNIILGPLIRVWVTVICRPRLFDRPVGRQLTWLVRLSRFRIRVVVLLFVVCRWWGPMRRFTRMPRCVARSLRRPRVRKTNFSSCCTVISRCLGVVVSLRLSSWIDFRRMLCR